ncbi:MAG TPA: YcaO-like family protein [Jatrophihabitans sp.]|jgi:thiazole/oxazole-forming peptide maturase SagD family component|nr:YcaO-like family protein [Jatrophihabitans sp.]
MTDTYPLTDTSPSEAHSPAYRSANYRRLVRAFYDEMSPAYERVWGPSFHFGTSTGAQSRAQAVAAAEQLVIDAARIGRGQRILDIGCGIGGPARAIAARTGAAVVGIDISWVNVHRAVTAGAPGAVPVPLGFVQGDAMTLPFITGSFDALYQFEAGCHLPDLDGWAAECCRVLAPGGRLVAYEWLAGESLDVRQRALNEDVCRSFALAELRSLSQVSSSLKAAGFTVLEARDLSAEGLIDGNWRRLSEESGYADPRFAHGGRRLVAAALEGAFIIGVVIAEMRHPAAAVLEVSDAQVGLLPHSPWRAEARLTGPPAAADIVGTGSAGTAALARTRAEMEAAERAAQFAPAAPAEVRARRAELRAALDPRTFGLYSPRQYGRPGFPVRPYDDTAEYRWAEVTDLRDGTIRYLPLEFLYPRAVSAPLVRETSSGTAAHRSFDLAATAAIYEVIERDAVLRWWYHAETAHPIRLETLPWADVADDIAALHDLGFVVVLARLDAVAGAAVTAAVALRGNASYLTSAAGATSPASIRHAVRELGRTIGDWQPFDRSGSAPIAADRVASSGDHHRLYQQQPYAGVIRGFLARTLAQPVAAEEEAGAEESPAPLVDSLARTGQHVYAAVLRDGTADGIHVVRALVPELVPFHIGHDRERFGHPRLIGGRRGTRLRTLLPHPFS